MFEKPSYCFSLLDAPFVPNKNIQEFLFHMLTAYCFKK